MGKGGSKWRLPSGSWRIQYYVDGQPRRETYPTEQAADARLAEVAQLKAASYDVGGGLQTVRAFFVDWLTQRQRSSRAERTLDADRRNVEAHIMPAIGDMRLSDVRARNLQSLLNDIQDDIAARTDGRFSGVRTAQLVATLLTQAFDVAVAQRLIPFSPMQGVEVPTYERAEVVPADEGQVARLLLAAQQTPMPALWYAYALLGLRRGEPLGWRVQDVNLHARTVRIAQQVQAVGGELKRPTPKRGSARTLPLPELIVPWVERRLAEVRAQRVTAGPAWHDLDLVFCRPESGLPLWPSTVNHWWYDLRERAGLAGHTLHSLRHAFATMLDEATVTEALAASILGHGKKSVTQRYTHPRVEAMRRPIEEVAQRVARAMERVREATG